MRVALEGSIEISATLDVEVTARAPEEVGILLTIRVPGAAASADAKA